MPVVNKEPRRFAVHLSEAITRSGMSLGRIVEQLEERGLTTTTASLSYWKTGRSLPRRAASRPIVRELEDILGLPNNYLLHAIEADVEETDRNIAAEAAAAPRFPHAPQPLDHEDTAQFNSVAAVINWESEVNREVFTDTMTISADYRTVTLHTSSFVRLPYTEAIPTYHVGFFWDRMSDLTPDSIGLHDLSGAELAAIDHLEEDKSEMARLEIPSTYAEPGSMHCISYTHRYDVDIPLEESVGRLYMWPLRFYSCRVEFEGEVPSDITWELTSVERDDDSVRRTTTIRPVQAVDGAVNVTLENLASAIGRFTWSVPSSVL